MLVRPVHELVVIHHPNFDTVAESASGGKVALQADCACTSGDNELVLLRAVGGNCEGRFSDWPVDVLGRVLCHCNCAKQHDGAQDGFHRKVHKAKLAFLVVAGTNGTNSIVARKEYGGNDGKEWKPLANGQFRST